MTGPGGRRDAEPSTRRLAPSRAARRTRTRRLNVRPHDAVPDLDLADFLIESGLDVDDVYDGRKSWSDLREDADAPIQPLGPHESVLRRSIGRLLHVDDGERLATCRRLLDTPHPPQADELADRDRRLLHMLVASVTDQAVTRESSLQEAVNMIREHPQVRSELLELFGVLDERIDHVHIALSTHPDAPLQIHARYTRIEILAAFGLHAGAKIPAWQNGFYEARPANAELLAFTLDKSSSGFSPTTRYRDYAISRNLIHWESQSVTRADSPTGLR